MTAATFAAMSQYVQQSDLSGLIPAEFFTQALDDVNAGVTDNAIFTQIATDASGVIDGLLGTRVSVPFQPDENGAYPPFVFNACKKLVAEQLYKRRGVTDDKNPFTKECDMLRDLMNKMALGTVPIDPSIQRKDPSASIITERARTVPRDNIISC